MPKRGNISFRPTHGEVKRTAFTPYASLRGRPRRDLAQLTAEILELHGRVIQLTTLHALGDRQQSRNDPGVRARLTDSLHALGVDGYLVLLRDDGGGPLHIALSVGIRSETALELASALAGRDRAPTRQHHDDLRRDHGPLRPRDPPLEGALAILPLAVGADGGGPTAPVRGQLALMAQRPGGLGDEVVELLAGITRELAVAADLALDRRPRRAPDDVARPRPDRSGFLAALGAALRRAGRDGTEASTAVVQVDSMRRVLETEGADAGAALLEQVTESLRRMVRSSDVLGRLGGGRYAALLAECDRDDALQVAEKLRRATHALAGRDATVERVSVGVSTWIGPQEDAEQLLEAAEACLEQAVDDGGDRTVART